MSLLNQSCDYLRWQYVRVVNTLLVQENSAVILKT